MPSCIVSAVTTYNSTPKLEKERGGPNYWGESCIKDGNLLSLARQLTPQARQEGTKDLPNAKIFSHKIHYKISDGYAVVRPEEACNEETTEALAHLASSELIDSKHLVLDLSHTKYVTTPGYRWILRRLQELESMGKSLTLVGLSPTVERTFKLLRLDESIPTAKTVPEALEMLGAEKAPAMA